jgi:hypothetical protein
MSPFTSQTIWLNAVRRSKAARISRSIALPLLLLPFPVSGAGASTIGGAIQSSLGAPLLETGSQPAPRAFARTGAAEQGVCIGGFTSPFEPGTYSTFVDENGLNEFTETVLPGFVNVNGVSTQVFEISGGELSGTRNFVTRDATGFKRYRVFQPNFFIEGFGFVDRTITFSPPTTAPVVICIGVPSENNVTALFEFSDGSSFSLNWEATALATIFEVVEVPLGTFEAMRVQTSLLLRGAIQGQPVEQRSTRIDWVVSGLGTVKYQVTEDGQTDVYQLVDTNRMQVPEPNRSVLALVALLVLSTLASARDVPVAQAAGPSANERLHR